MRRVLATVVATLVALVLLLSFKTHSLTSTAAPAAVSTPAQAPSAAAPAVPSSAAPSGALFGPAAPSTAGPSTTSPKATTTKSAASRTVDGDAVETRYGAVQVRVALTGSTITGITMLQVPDREQRDIEINDQAVPILTQETLQAQSAKIDMVSGATYTSQGYLQSLQSALDKSS